MGDGASTAQAKLDRVPSSLLAASMVAFAIALIGASAAVAETLSTTFNYTGAEQTFTVPEGVTSVHVVATGAAGGASGEGYPGEGLPSVAGGRGAVVSGNLTVSSGTLYVEVGGAPEPPESCEFTLCASGFNGGARSTGGGGGGGASDVRTTTRSEPNTLASRLLVAAGGGGSGISRGRCAGGAGGDAGASGGTSEGHCGNGSGGPGTETAGGSAGDGRYESGPSEAGSLGVGGVGNADGGGGGGGLYGGGGGAPEGCGGPHGPCLAAGGGGGGSNLVPKGGRASLDRNGAPPQITITYSSPPTVTELQPSYGQLAGGTHVTITGSNLNGATAVKFGTVNATRFRIRSQTSITATAPPGTGTVYVTVTTPGGTSPVGAPDQFTYAVPGEWTIFPTPSLDGEENSLSGISCLSRRFCIAVGHDEVSGEEALIDSWNGTAWSKVGEVPQPPPSTERSNGDIRLSGVSCTSVKFCVAVGHGYHLGLSADGSGGFSFAETWNGTMWSESQLSPSKATLSGVSCVSRTFCIAVGTNNHEAIGEGPGRPLVESWNGTEWSVIPAPNPTPVNDELNGVSCVSASFCVAVGEDLSFGDKGEVREPGSLVESWNGTEWSVIPAPGTGPLKGVSCVNVKRCVAVGGSEHCESCSSTDVSGTLVEAWNGGTWSIVESPKTEGSGIPQLDGVSCVSTRSCAAVGSDSTYEGPSQTLVEAWQGGKWVIVPSANSASGVSHLDGVSCVSAQSCFAVGGVLTLVESGGIQSFGGFGFGFG